MRGTFNTLGTSEAAPIRVLGNVLGGGAKYVYSGQFSVVVYELKGASLKSYDHGTWPHVTDKLI